MRHTLLIKKSDNDGRLALIPEYLQSEWTIEIGDAEDARDFASKFARADAMISMNWKASFGTSTKLKLLQLPGAGTDDIDFASIPGSASVCNAFEHEIGISEYVLAAMLHWEIGIASMDQNLRRDDWSGSYLCGPRHGELHGKTIGVVGYGHIGMEVARRARAFGMRVIACTRTPRLDPFADRVSGMDQLGELLGASDYVVIGLPLDESTRGLFNAPRFAQMKSTAVIINVARGPIIDEQALFDACRANTIGGAIIDTWYQYPQQGERMCVPATLPFRDLPNVVMTPHASGWTEGLRPRRCRIMAENLNRLARGEPLINVVKQPTTEHPTMGTT
jgi:phosphoglycerate dehydrogenase-like enzyme